MKGYVFVCGVDGIGADTAPAHEIGVYLDFDKAFKKLVELNHEKIQDYMANGHRFYEEGYTVDDYPSTDWEAVKAAEEEDWELLDAIIDKHIIEDEVEINKLFINEEPCYGMEESCYGMYAIEEIEIIE
jgi:hypothetical protein